MGIGKRSSTPERQCFAVLKGILQLDNSYFKNLLEDTARYAGLLLAAAEGFDPCPGQGFFCPSGKKRAYYAVLVHFLQFLVKNSKIKI